MLFMFKGTALNQRVCLRAQTHKLFKTLGKRLRCCSIFLDHDFRGFMLKGLSMELLGNWKDSGGLVVETDSTATEESS